MQFGAAFGYFVNKTGGLANLLLLTLCQLIPVVGPIVGLGYRAEVAESLARDPEMLRHPNFQFERFIEYLTRGVWPFLTALVLALAVLIPAVLVFVGAMVFAGVGNQPLVGLAVGGGVYLLALIAMVALSVPMMLHAELTARFDLPGAFRFAVEFWRLVPGPAIFTGVVFFPLALLVGLLGLLCCIIGLYPANTITQMAAQHLTVQLYREYLDRGGEPLIDDGYGPGEPDEPPDPADWR
jgi:hypothetical protein